MGSNWRDQCNTCRKPCRKSCHKSCHKSCPQPILTPQKVTVSTGTIAEPIVSFDDANAVPFAIVTSTTGCFILTPIPNFTGKAISIKCSHNYRVTGTVTVNASVANVITVLILVVADDGTVTGRAPIVFDVSAGTTILSPISPPFVFNEGDNLQCYIFSDNPGTSILVNAKFSFKPICC